MKPLELGRVGVGQGYGYAVRWGGETPSVYFGCRACELGRNEEKSDKKAFKSRNAAGLAFPHQPSGEFST